MNLLKKESDMICYNCNKFISHKKVKWNPRKMHIPLKGDLTIKFDDTASPNDIFGFQEHEYRGQCPECKTELTGFWFGWKSLLRHGSKPEIHTNPFKCTKCDNVIQREFQFWYSNRYQINEEIEEYLITICLKCKNEQAYPFEYNLEKGIIE